LAVDKTSAVFDGCETNSLRETENPKNSQALKKQPI